MGLYVKHPIWTGVLFSHLTRRYKIDYLRTDNLKFKGEKAQKAERLFE